VKEMRGADPGEGVSRVVAGGSRRMRLDGDTQPAVQTQTVDVPYERPMLRPVVILGAARSGTKMLRDVMASAREVNRVAYDINFVWRMGNETAPSDVLTRDDVPDAKVGAIRRYLRRQQCKAQFLVEKTVANSLRPTFVSAVLPEATFVVVVRDPVDVVESAMRQWQAKPDLRYSMAKARHYPWTLAPGYATRHLVAMGRRFTRADRALPPVWGPEYPGVHDDLAAGVPLLDVCLAQWLACNQRMLTQVSAMRAPTVTISYEALVAEPTLLNSLSLYLGLPAPDQAALRRINADTVGRGSAVLSPTETSRIRAATKDVWDQWRDVAEARAAP
jgi:Sulfotransferase family